VLRTPDDRFDRLPGYAFTPNYVAVQTRGIDPVRMHYVDAGPADGPVVLLLHGQPTWSYLYRDVIPVLAGAGLRVIAPDNIGYGRSDKLTDATDYTFRRHVDWMHALVTGLDLRDITVVVQDWGGPIGLRWAVENADRVARLAILNTGLFTGRVSKGFLAWRDFAERNPDLPVGFVVNGATATDLDEAVAAAYEAPFPTPESKAGAAQFPLIVPTSDEDTGAAEMRAVSDELSRWDKPALVAFSDSDPVFPFPRSGQVFCDLIPGAGEQVKIEGAAHFLQEDKGERIAEHLLGFLRS
jgi:haloalkane dehalogenase